ncbi:hypothetical protein CRG98_011341 [Punica granatum]|uniref:Uncharacterized protein n=1 Tax=Punica granatum TaxID=22663 RepID=A0A2I0KIF8_PUNGR|nr:hypothetical protein CRG98_011341 [Punica granatum]
MADTNTPDLNARIYIKRMETLWSDEEGHADETCILTNCLPLPVTQSISITLMPKVSANHEVVVTPLNRKDV